MDASVSTQMKSPCWSSASPELLIPQQSTLPRSDPADVVGRTPSTGDEAAAGYAGKLSGGCDRVLMAPAGHRTVFAETTGVEAASSHLGKGTCGRIALTTVLTPQQESVPS